MKIAVATEAFSKLAGHAGQSRQWLIYDCIPGNALPVPSRIELGNKEVFHHWSDDTSLAGHPLDGIEIIIAKSAGDSFLAKMQKRGIQVLLTAETVPSMALQTVLDGKALPDARWDVTQLLCKLHDLFGHH